MVRKGLGHYCVELLEGLAKLPGDSLVIVETGTMFKTALEPGETDLSARSTYAIAKWAANAHVFISIDKDREHLRTAYRYLDSQELNCMFLQGNAAEVLNGLTGCIDFVLLDSDSDADVILAEYNAVKDRMGQHSIILIDDAFKHPSVNKFRKVREQVEAWYPIGGIAAAVPFGPEAHRICGEVSLANGR